MNITDLEKILHGDLDQIDKVDVNDVALPGDDVIIYPCDVKDMLLEFLSGKLDANDLNKWAVFITLRGEYTPPGDVFDHDGSDYYENMMHIIQRLSTPEIDGAITPQLVKEYLSEILKYKNNDAKIISVTWQIINILKENGKSDLAKVIGEIRHRYIFTNNKAEAAREFITLMTGGKGSFSDFAEENDKLAVLKDQLFNACQDIITNDAKGH